MLAAAASPRRGGARAAVAYLEEALEIAPDRDRGWLELGELEAWLAAARRPRRRSSGRSQLLEDAEPLTLARAWLRAAARTTARCACPASCSRAPANALELLAQVAPGGRGGAQRGARRVRVG